MLDEKDESQTYQIYIALSKLADWPKEQDWRRRGSAWMRTIKSPQLAEWEKSVSDQLSGASKFSGKKARFVIRDQTQATGYPMEGDAPVFYYEGLIRSAAMRKAIESIVPFAFTPLPILIEGETGTGKEILARSIWRSSGVKGPFVVVNTQEFPGTLIDSALFGYKRGAFTGAISDRKGLIEEAAGGVLFLDELQDIDRAVQEKLIRVLNNGRFRALGATQDKQSNARIIAATNMPVSKLVGDKLREDLFYRIGKKRVRMPSLREQREAIWPTFLSMVHKASTKLQKDVVVSPDSVIDVVSFDWPGNYRQLEAVADGAVVLGSENSGIIDRETVLVAIRDSDPRGVLQSSQFPSLDEVIIQHIEKALAAAQGNRTEANRLLKFRYSTLTDWIRDFKIDESRFKPERTVKKKRNP